MIARMHSTVKAPRIAMISVAGIDLAATFVAASLAENSAVEPIIAMMPRRLALDRDMASRLPRCL